MKTLKLDVLDRLMLPQLLPQSGGKIEMLMVETIVKKIDFTADEISEFGLNDANGMVKWTSSRDVDFEFTQEQVEMMKKSARKADEEGKVTRHNLPVIEKIESLNNSI